MASTVIAAFEQFLRATVNLDLEQTNSARSSRGWLLDQVHGFRHVSNAVYAAVDDPKRIEGDLNTLDYDMRTKISSCAVDDAKRADRARHLEGVQDMQGSIEAWGEIFGPDFPKCT